MYSKTFTKKEIEIFKSICNEIEKFNKIIILGHASPDGDSLGSQIGLQKLLQENFKDKKIMIGGDYSTLANFKFLNPVPEKIVQKDFDEGLTILVDLQDKERTEYSNYCFKNLLIIDHHEKTKEHIVRFEWIDAKFPAAAQMISFLARGLKWKFNKEPATALLTGIITDTGNFKYDSVNYETFENASFLLKKGVDLKIIEQNVNKITSNDIKILKYIYKNIIIENKLICLTFKPKDKKNIPFVKNHTEIRKFINHFNFVKNNLVIAFFIQLNKENKVNCSLRGDNEFNVQIIAKKFGGGGHIAASGIKLDNWLEVEKVLEEIKKRIKIFK